MTGKLGDYACSASVTVALFVTSCHSNPKHYPNMGRYGDENMSKF